MTINHKKLNIALAGAWGIISIPLSYIVYRDILGDDGGFLMRLFALVVMMWPVGVVLGWRWMTEGDTVPAVGWMSIVGVGLVTSIIASNNTDAANTTLALCAILSTLVFITLVWASKGNEIYADFLVFRRLYQHPTFRKWAAIFAQIFGLFVAYTLTHQFPHWVTLSLLAGILAGYLLTKARFLPIARWMPITLGIFTTLVVGEIFMMTGATLYPQQRLSAVEQKQLEEAVNETVAAVHTQPSRTAGDPAISPTLP